MPNDSYSSIRNNARPSAGAFDPVQGKWVIQSPMDKVTPKKAVSKEVVKKNKPTSPVSKSNNSKSKKKADKEFIDTEYNTLQGDLVLIPTKETIKIKAGDTIRIEGIGKFLSGLYFVSAVSRTIDDSNGYSHTFTVIKTGFGDSLKDSAIGKKSPATASKTVRNTPKVVKK